PSGPGTQFNLMNPLPPFGTLGSLRAGEVRGLTLNANRAMSIATTGSAALGLNGNIDHSILAVDNVGSAIAPSVAITSLSVAGNLSQSAIQVTDSITTFTVGQNVTGSTVAVAYDPANPGASVTTLTAGSWSNTSLTANSVSTFKVTGNANLGIAG